MSIHAHLDSLHQKHQELEAKIHHAHIHHLPTHELKVEKLRLKDEIYKFEGTAYHPEDESAAA